MISRGTTLTGHAIASRTRYRLQDAWKTNNAAIYHQYRTRARDEGLERSLGTPLPLASPVSETPQIGHTGPRRQVASTSPPSSPTPRMPRQTAQPPAATAADSRPNPVSWPTPKLNNHKLGAQEVNDIIDILRNRMIATRKTIALYNHWMGRSGTAGQIAPFLCTREMWSRDNTLDIAHQT
ncbi:hypothetical protein XA68_18224 [Ophiocordyceps unilateralis]|uniref:Uncharacterized protein n=1 Tax=Ophiocordyceps unilateralis TaxID=268505 RepID=A0A2A9PRV7_OPHUN|nr:hypothetical protein XA68_18224 [Ophiocordyceps unilateralis]